VELATLEKSLEVIKKQKLSYIKQGLNPMIIYLGIMNIALTGLIVGRIPEYYWIYQEFKVIFMLICMWKVRI
jgi:K+-transporting ATPase A subunit